LLTEWTESLSVGIDEIDTQHKEIFRIVAEFIASAGNNNDCEELAKVMKFLEEYVVVHFALEENFMVQCNYPPKLLLHHEEQHTDFWEHFNELKDEFIASGPSEFFLTRFKMLLYDWLVNHIHKVDKALGEFVRSKGAESKIADGKIV
jgi:hemerythrin